MASPLLSELAFGSLLVYSPRGTSETSRRSREYRDRFKAGDQALVESAVARLSECFADSGLDAVLEPDVALVPAPRSGLLLEGALWPARIIADALARAGFGATVVPLLRRTEAVPKSAFQPPGERPNALRHYQTMAVEPELVAMRRITVVDDFVTKGNTLLGGASRLVEAIPNAEIRAFALVRTLGLQPEIERVLDPRVGRIRAVAFEADREP